MPVPDDQIDRNSDTPDRIPDACPFCGHALGHHQVLPGQIRSWACRCGWWRFMTPDGTVEEQDRETWEKWRRWRQGLP